MKERSNHFFANAGFAEQHHTAGSDGDSRHELVKLEHGAVSNDDRVVGRVATFNAARFGTCLGDQWLRCPSVPRMTGNADPNQSALAHQPRRELARDGTSLIL